MSKIQKSKYKHFNKKGVKSTLDINFKGFLCSCNNREKDCVREAYNLLNKYADLLYPTQEREVKTEENTELSIEDELQREISGLKAKKRFQQIESGAKNFLFIKTTLEDPVQLAQKIVSDIESNGVQQTRFLIRLVPIQTTCKAYIKDITTAFQPFAQKYFKENPTTYSIVYNHRNNNNVNKEELVQAVAELVSQTNSENKVDLKAANISIIIEIIKGIALIGIVPNYIKFKKYNLLSIVQKEEEQDKAENDSHVIEGNTSNEVNE